MRSLSSGATADESTTDLDDATDTVRCLWLTKGLGRGGVERLLVDLLPLVDSDRFEIDVAYVLPWKNNYHRALEELGASVHCLGSGGVGDVRWIFRLVRLMRQRRYQVIHTHAPVPAIVARLASLTPNGPAMVHTEHNVWSRYRLPTRVLNSLTYHRNRAAIAVSAVVAESIQPMLSSRAPDVSTVHHGTVPGSVRSWSTDERIDRRRKLGLPDEDFLIGNVANFTPKKDHRNLLDALAAGSSIAKAHLVLIGLGPLEDELRAAVTTLGVADRVTFLGSRDDVFEILPLLDLFCLSSQFEGFPIALVEAMATGLPCVATSAGGIPEIVIDGQNGLLVDPGDPEALRSAIERVMADPDLANRLGRAAKGTAEGLDLRTAARALEQVYVSVVETDRT